MFRYYSLGQFYKWGHSSQARLNIIFFWGRILPGLCVCLSTYPKYALAKIENFGGLRNPLKNPENSKNKNLFILYFRKKQLFYVFVKSSEGVHGERSRRSTLFLLCGLSEIVYHENLFISFPSEIQATSICVISILCYATRKIYEKIFFYIF